LSYRTCIVTGASSAAPLHHLVLRLTPGRA
jgi:hypothetical protein